MGIIQIATTQMWRFVTLLSLMGIGWVQGRVLVAMCVGVRDIANVNELMGNFTLPQFNVILFHYDNDIIPWQQLPWYNDTIRVQVHRQMKWWYFKRFLHPDIIAEYKYVFIVDSDLLLVSFDAATFVRTLDLFDVRIGQASNCKGIGCTAHPSLVQKPSYRSTNLQHTPSCDHFETDARVGRWTTHIIESGPFVAFSRDTWRCVWNNILVPDLTSGWCIDGYWVSICGQGRAAIFDFMCICQEDRRTASDQSGYNPMGECRFAHHHLHSVPRLPFLRLPQESDFIMTSDMK